MQCKHKDFFKKTLTISYKRHEHQQNDSGLETTKKKKISGEHSLNFQKLNAAAEKCACRFLFILYYVRIF